ncbi:MAG: diacylglycerol kinase family lipid kinase [Sphingomonadales bacterium]
MSVTQLCRPRRHFFIIYNPIAGRRRTDRLRAVVQALRQQGAEVTVTPTRAPGHASTLACALWDGEDGAHPDTDVVVAAGGDGTISEVAAGLVGSELTLGVIPLGTANVLAQDLKLLGGGWSAPRIARQLMRGDARDAYLGRVRQSDGGMRAFVMMAGAGFDGAAVHAVNQKLKRAVGPLAYGWAGLATLARDDGGRVLLRTPERQIEADWVVVTNGCHYGGAYKLAPGASVFQPSLTAIAVTSRGRWGMVQQLWRLGIGQFGPNQGVERLEGRQFELEAQDRRPIWLQCDGDVIGQLPVKIDLFEQSLRLITAELVDFAPESPISGQQKT